MNTIQKLKILLAGGIIASLLLVYGSVATTSPAFAASPTGSCTSASSCACVGAHTIDTGTGTGSDTGCSATKSGVALGGIINTVINIMSLLVGALAIIMILVAGIRFITSGGGEGAAAAKNTLIYALIGLAVAALAQVMVHFVLNRVSHPSTPQPTSFNSTGNTNG